MTTPWWCHGDGVDIFTHVQKADIEFYSVITKTEQSFLLGTTGRALVSIDKVFLDIHLYDHVTVTI